MKYIITILIVGALSAGMFVGFLTHAQSDGGLTQTDTLTPDDQVSLEFINALSQYKALRLSDAVNFFQRKDFLSFIDFSQTIPAYNIGRPNPFAPLDGVVLPPGSKVGSNLGFSSVQAASTTK